MKTLIKFIIVFSFIITYQNSYSKPIPPGSGAGDVPANILFLLDTSASMNEEISASGTSVGQTNDLVELSDGYLIIAEKGGGIIKMSIADGIKDGSFAGGAGRFDEEGKPLDAWGGPFAATKGLIQDFGAHRIKDTPISEAGFLGAAIGAALTGLRPVVDLMYFDFTTVAFDQLLANAAKSRYMFGGQTKVPLTLFATSD